MIKLVDLLPLREQQAPAAPVAPPAAQPPVPTPPAAAPDPSSQVPTEEPPSEEPAPEEGMGEYDFTKDFRAYQDAVNKADNMAKKAFIKKSNAQLVGKTVTANASRGYGQPKSDYEIKGVKKVSVDWYYKEDVVVLTDENDKKYFLTPGVNIKIEAGEPEQPEVPAEPATDQTPQEPEAPAAPAEPAAGVAPQGTEVPPTTAPSPPAAVPGQQPAQGQEPPPESPEDLKKKKKKVAAPMAEVCKGCAQKDIGSIFESFVKDEAKDINGVFQVKPFVKQQLRENKEDTTILRYELEIPKDIFNESFDAKEFQLDVSDKMRTSRRPGQQFTRGSVDIMSVGRNYLFKFEKQTGWGI